MATASMSHNEVWDDSALVDSWNEALDEYKKYHSIAAKGERVEDILAAAEELENAAPEETSNRDADAGLPAWEPKDEVMTEELQAETGAAESIVYDTIPQVQQEQKQPVASNISSAMPQALMNTVQDEGLKNLMMSWYYAGYYTGLYEGQQKAALAATQTSSQPNGRTG